MHPHRSSALDGAAAALTVARTRVETVPLSWSWSHHPRGRAWAAAPSEIDTILDTLTNDTDLNFTADAYRKHLQTALRLHI